MGCNFRKLFKSFACCRVSTAPWRVGCNCVPDYKIHFLRCFNRPVACGLQPGKILVEINMMLRSFNRPVACGLQQEVDSKPLPETDRFQPPRGVWVATEALVSEALKQTFQPPRGVWVATCNTPVQKRNSPWFQPPRGVWVATRFPLYLECATGSVSTAPWRVGCNAATTVPLFASRL